MLHSTRIAVDLAKSVFEIVVSDHPGKVVDRHRLPRGKFLEFFANRPAATVVLEACGSAHFWARQIESLGHRVVLLPPAQVRPYVLRNKTDRTDTRGILEAHRNEDIHPVPIKTIDQQALTSLHRIRSAWVAERTAKINLLRGLLRELGLVIPVGAKKAVPHAAAFIADEDSGIPHALRPVFAELCDEIRALSDRIDGAERQREAIAQQSAAANRLRTIPGVGLLVATSVLAFVGDIHRFPSGRHFASYLGLTPRESSSGMRRSLGGITKRGDCYLRTMLIHGARAALVHAHRTPTPDRLRTWALQLERTMGSKRASVALANKMARIVWAVLTHDRDFQSVPVAA
jgi:transposase